MSTERVPFCPPGGPEGLMAPPNPSLTHLTLGWQHEENLWDPPELPWAHPCSGTSLRSSHPMDEELWELQLKKAQKST